jgi:DNA polymerase
MEKVKKELQEIIQSLKAYIETERLAGIEEFYLRPLPKVRRLEKLAQEVIQCKQCPLYKTRKKPVFGEGNPQAKLVFVGEAPGKEEDLQGLPFVGMAGQLLTKIIEAMGFKRKDVYICNVLKCRPPQNRNPLPSEIIACQDYLRQQLEIISPKIVCCLGRYACNFLSKEDVSITKLRGKFQEFNGMKIMPTFHPAYLLRNPSAKHLVWQDMQKIMAELKNG